MNRKQHTVKTGESGFTLLELLLVVGVSAMMFLGITQITKSWVESERAGAAGRNLEQVTAVMDKFLRANWTNLNVIASDADDVLADAVSLGTLSPWNDLLQSLIAAGLLTAADGANLRSPLNTRLVISYHPPGAGEPRRLVVYTEGAVPNKRALDTARKGGTFAGTVMNYSDPTRVISAFGQWSVPRAELAGVSAPPDNGHGFVVGIVSYNEDTLYGPYLYRQAITGAPELNQMGTNLDMAQHDVVNGGTITSNNLDVVAAGGTTGQAQIGGALTAGGISQFNGPTVANAGLTANRLTVTGDGEFAGNITAATGDIQAGTMNASTINAPAIQTANFQAGNLDVQGNMTLSDDIAVQGDLNVAGTVTSNEVNTGQLNSSGPITAGAMKVSNNLTLQPGAVLTIPSGGGGAIYADRLVADDCVVINGTVYPSGAGC